MNKGKSGYLLLVVAISAGYHQVASAQVSPPEIIDPETNRQVEFLRVDWTPGEYAQTTISCREQTYQVPFEDQYNNAPGVALQEKWFSDGPGGFFLPSYRVELSTDGTYRSETSLSINFGIDVDMGVWAVNDGQLEFSCPAGGCQFIPEGLTDTYPAESPYAENGVMNLSPFAAFVGGEIAFYPGQTGRMICNATPGSFKLTSVKQVAAECTVAEPVVANNDCDYSNASIHEGWGWNAVTMLSCPPLIDYSQCDYSLADENNGWGWIDATSTSCPPL